MPRIRQRGPTGPKQKSIRQIKKDIKSWRKPNYKKPKKRGKK